MIAGALALALALAAPASGADTDAPPSVDDTDASSVSDGGPEGPLAPDPAPPAAAPPEPESDDIPVGPADDEIVVYGEHLVEQARARVERSLVEQGYDHVIQKDDHRVYRHAAPWKGEVRVYDDGWIRLKRQPVQFRPPEDLPTGWATCIVVPLCIRTGGQTVSRAKMIAQRRRTLVAVEPLARQWGDRVADLHVDQTVAGLPERLQALWDEGAPLDDGAAPLATPAERRLALLAYWDSRTDTLWGYRVQAAVEAFIREEVQYSPFPYTPDEIAAFNDRRRSERVLDLERPWASVLADLEARAGQ